MKVTFLLVSVLIAGTFAAAPDFECTGNSFTCFFKEAGHKIKYHADKLGDKLSDVGTAVLNSAVDKGKDVLTNGAQALLGAVLEHLDEEGLMGKRAVSFFDKIRGHVTDGISMMKEAKKAIHASFEKAVRKLTGMMGDMSALKGIEDEADKKIDGVVEEFKKEGKKGFASLASTIAGKLQAIFKEGMDQIKAKFGKKMETRAILGFDSFSDAWEKAKGAFSDAGDSLAATFQPHLDRLTQTVSDLADQAKEHGSNLVDSAVDSFNDLKDKLNTHVETLKGHASKIGDHATDALAALQQAIGDIANQTLKNVADTAGDAVKTGKDAVDTVVDHVSGGSY